MVTNRKRYDRKWFWTGFVKSNYITALWNWFMGLAGKASEPVLFASVLYSGYQLVPGVPLLSPGINALAFVTQQAALDVGGMGLIKLTKDEDPKKFKFARRTGVALIALMVINMVVATAGRVFNIPSPAMQFVEGILLIVRSVFAVLFGHAIHTLKDEKVDVDLDQNVDEIVAQALESETEQIRADFEAKFEALMTHISEAKNQPTFGPTFEQILSLPEHESFEQSRTTDPLQNVVETDPKVESIQTSKITRILDPGELKSFGQKSVQKKPSVSKKSEPKLPKLTGYLYTKKEVAKLAKCSEFEVEKALKNGVLQTSKNGDKILKSSLTEFIVARQKVKQKMVV